MAKALESLSENLVISLMADAVAVQPIRKEVPLQSIKIVDEESIEYQGHRLKINKAAFRDMLDILKVPKTFMERFKGIVGVESQQKFINSLKNVIASSGNGNVTLVLNPTTREVVAVHKNTRNLFSNQSATELISNIISEGGLSVADFSVNHENGGIAVNTFNTNTHFDIPGLKDENFIAGISFTNNPRNGFQVTPYINRLVCANGMITRGFVEEFKISKLDELSMNSFMASMRELRRNNYMPTGFADAVRLTNSTNASLAEMNFATNAILDASKATREDVESWIPMKATESAFSRIGVHVEDMDLAKRRNAKTGTSVWELINGITHFATHENGIEISDYDRRRLQVVAGNLLTKKLDMENLVRSPF
jgi:hypothetical protein